MKNYKEFKESKLMMKVPTRICNQSIVIKLKMIILVLEMKGWRLIVMSRQSISP